MDSIEQVPGDTVDNASKTELLTTQLVVASSVGISSFLLFCFLRTRWNVIFAPRSRLVGISPDRLPTSFFGWIIPLFKIQEDAILDKVGLDAVVLLGFFKMAYKLFAFCGFFALVVLFPIKFSNYFPGIGDGEPGNGEPGNDTFNNIYDNIPLDDTPESFGLLLSYLLFTWVFTLATFYFTFYNYREFTEFRHSYYCKWKYSITARSVMVTVIPKELQDGKALAEYYESLGLGSVQSAVVYRLVRKLRHAIEKRTHYLKKLEEACTDYLDNPCVDPNYDPVKSLKEFEETSTNNGIGSFLPEISGERPTMRTGFLHIFGKKVDKIDYYANLFKYYDKLVELGRRGAYTPTSVGFVTFENMTSAQLASQVLICPKPFKCTTALAPGPRDVYWHNLSIRQREMLLRSVIVTIAIILIVFFWSIPILYLSTLLDMDTLEKVFPWLKRLAEQNEILKAFIQGSLPTLAVTIFFGIVPKVMKYFSRLQGYHARSTIEFSTFSKYFLFLLVNYLLVFTIGGTIINTLGEIIIDPTGLPYKLATTLPRVAHFFVNLVVLQGIGLLPTHLLQMSDIIFAWANRVFLAKTPREYAEANTPPFLDYGEELPPIVLIFVITLVYSSITPIIILFGTIYFFLCYLTYKYLLLYVYFHPYSTHGLAWPKIFHRIIVGLYIFQTLMIGYLSMRKCYVMAGSLVPILVCTAVYHYYVNAAYNRIADFVPLQNLREEENKLPTNSYNSSKDNISDVLEDDLYHAAPDLYTDYSQPPMTLYKGVLNTGMQNYGAPALVGILPWLWLPIKGTIPDEPQNPGFFRRLLGMNKKASTQIVDRSVAEESEPLLGNGSDEPEEPTIADDDTQNQLVSQTKINEENLKIQNDPENKHGIYYPHPERVPENSSDIPSGSNNVHN
ncbi:hypothetical protein Glove_593g9 [Diversispora epigaea]|uniref:CSC1/OSCA1-like 7TM region domain-containing protein n=1 Tax=Diversispora epigaea TaxID=1348612 RepID=A0A397GCD0_9GLOM|nr:hypothetical protein Glove_593g9 [Diversispora epigaea]